MSVTMSEPLRNNESGLSRDDESSVSSRPSSARHSHSQQHNSRTTEMRESVGPHGDDAEGGTASGYEKDNASDTSSSASAVPKKKLGTIATAFFVFVSTAAGPFGVEETVSAAGPLPTLLFTFVCPLIVIVPICLLMEELGSWMPTNHGSIRWVARGLGPTVGFFNAFYQMMMNLVDLAVYPAMASDYLLRKFAIEMEDNFAVRYLLRVAIILVFGIPNYFPMRDVGMLSAVITLIIMTPFIVGVCAQAKNIETSSWGQVNTADMDISTLLAIGFWMYTGFLANSNITGECEPRALLKGQLIALVFDVAFYFGPLAAVLQLDTNWSDWDDGYLSILFDRIMPGLGYAVSIAGAFSSAGLYVSSLTTYCRTMWGIAELGWLPKILTRTNRYDVPYINATILICTTLILNLLDFSFLVKLEFVFASFTYIFFVLAFIFLRYNEPDTFRPFRVPGGELGGLLIPMPLIILVSAVLGADFTDWRLLTAFVGMTIFAFGLHAYLAHHRTAGQINALRRLLYDREEEIMEDSSDDGEEEPSEMCPMGM